MRRASDFGELLRTALPLVVVALISSFGVFADRFFLGRHSQSALAAVTPAAILTNTFFCFIITTVSYTGTFIAHYYGGNRQQQAVRALAQGLWLSGLSIFALLAALLIGNHFIRASCPPGELMRDELAYFNTTLPSQMFVTFSAVFIGYYTAERKAALVALAAIGGCIANLILDPLLIFGWKSIPSLGITGAGLATIVSSALTTGILAYPFLRRMCRWGKLRALLAFNRGLSLRILRFAFPNAISYLIGTICFYAFICALSKSGETALAVSNVCLCVNGLYFAVIDGLRQAQTVLTGRCCGANDSPSANRVLVNALKSSACVLIPVSITYFLFGGQIAAFFAKTGPDFDAYLKIGCVLFAVLIVNDIFETIQTLLTAALLGAGDTAFSMKSATFVQLFFWMPLVALLLAFDSSIVILWLSLAAWRVLHVLILALRWRSGKWKHIQLT